MISCNNHDYIEIACMYRYPVVINFKSGFEITGVAIDTYINTSRQECLKIISAGTIQRIVLDEIHKLTVQTDDAKFKELILD